MGDFAARACRRCDACCCTAWAFAPQQPHALDQHGLASNHEGPRAGRAGAASWSGTSGGTARRSILTACTAACATMPLRDSSNWSTITGPPACRAS